MKILIIFNCLGIGGAQTYTISLANKFIEKGHDVRIIVLSDTLTLKDRITNKIDVFVYPRKKKIDINVIRKIREFVYNNNPEVIISSYDIYTKIALLFIKNKPLVLYPIHTTKPRNFKNYIFSFIFFKIKLKNEYYLSTIKTQTDYLVKIYKLSKDFFYEINNGVDIQKFSIVKNTDNNDILRNYLKIPEDHKIILMVAGFRKEKRHDIAIKSFTKLKKNYNKVTFIIIGDNRTEEYNDLINLKNKQKIKDIIILTAEKAGSLINYYNIADVFTLTSDKVETFPITVLEAMACGLPCVLTKVGGTEDIIKEKINGYLCEVNDIEDIAIKWELALENEFSKNEIRKNIIDNYSIENSYNKHLDLINFMNLRNA